MADFKFDLARVYPYVCPEEGYAPTLGSWELGHEVRVNLVMDGGGMCVSVGPDLLPAGVTTEHVRETALENLATLWKTQASRAAQGCRAPDGTMFMLLGGHWLAASCIVTPGLHAALSKALGSDRLCASIPHREVLIVFPEKDPAFRDAMRKLIRENETEDAQKPITWELFAVTAAGVSAFVEPGSR